MLSVHVVRQTIRKHEMECEDESGPLREKPWFPLRRGRVTEGLVAKSCISTLPNSPTAVLQKQCAQFYPIRWKPWSIVNSKFQSAMFLAC